MLGCTSARIQNLPAPLVSNAEQFESLEACESRLAALYAAEQKKEADGEASVDLSEARCEEQGASAGDVVGGFFALVLGASLGAVDYLDAKY
ncbi:MAG: hypothetical protein ACU85V_04625 [Gammaproteobacteria bacterium]